MAETGFEKYYADDWDEAPPLLSHAPSSPTPLDTVSTAARKPLTISGPKAPSAIEPDQLLAIPSSASEAMELAGPPAGEASTVPPREMPHRDDPRMPGLLARSALFGAGLGSGQAVIRKLAPIGCYPPYKLAYEGPRLTMKDKQVWELALEAAKRSGPAGEEFKSSLSALAKGMGRKRPGGADTSLVRASLERLAGARVEFTLGDGFQGSGSLLLSARESVTGWWIAFDPALCDLFERDIRFPMDAERRAMLKTELARWLHDFLSTHDDYEKGYKLADLRRLSGYEADPSQFSSKLRDALADLVEKAPSLVKSFKVTRVGRESDDWVVRIEMLAAKATGFAMPPKAWAGNARRSGSKAPETRGSGARRGGPAL